MKQRQPNLFCVGFAAETEDVVSNARIKLQKKSIDMIIANQVGVANQGFDSDYNAVDVLWQSGNHSLSRARKYSIARALVKLIATQFEHTIKNKNVSYLSAKQN